MYGGMNGRFGVLKRGKALPGDSLSIIHRRRITDETRQSWEIYIRLIRTHGYL